MKKTYIISCDGYMYDHGRMVMFRGTWRELLEDLNGVTNENRDEMDPDEPMARRFPSQFSDEELENLFHDANGDGQDFMMVWCVEDGKQVL